jgi:phage shock protein A
MAPAEEIKYLTKKFWEACHEARCYRHELKGEIARLEARIVELTEELEFYKARAVMRPGSIPIGDRRARMAGPLGGGRPSA